MIKIVSKLSAPSHFAYFMQLKGEIFRDQPGRRTQRVQIGSNTYFIKQHFGVGWLEIFKNLFQLKWPILGAKNEWLAIQRLQGLKIAVPKVLAYGLEGKNPARQQSFLLMEELKGYISLEDFCRDWNKTKPAFALKKALLLKVAHIARTLHENGINHRDFYICHFLMDAKQDLTLIDLHRAGITHKLVARWRIKDLAGLYFSSKDIGLTSRDLLRFLKAYRQSRLRDVILNEAPFWQRVKERGDKLYDAHAHRE